MLYEFSNMSFLCVNDFLIQKIIVKIGEEQIWAWIVCAYERASQCTSVTLNSRGCILSSITPFWYSFMLISIIFYNLLFRQCFSILKKYFVIVIYFYKKNLILVHKYWASINQKFVFLSKFFKCLEHNFYKLPLTIRFLLKNSISIIFF